jgi:putative endonuclease
VQKQFYVYLLASKSRTLYVGVTSDLQARLYQHKNKQLDGFTAQYNIDRLVYFEVHNDALTAITREKQIKKWSRAKKIALIEKTNPTWEDLSEQWA